MKQPVLWTPKAKPVIQKNLKAIARGRSVLIVSHRLSIVSHADMIMVLDNGEQSACGTHRELLAQPAFTGNSGHSR